MSHIVSPLHLAFFGPAFLDLAKKGRAKKRGRVGGERMFEAKEVAKTILIEIRPVLALIKKHDADLFDQAYRAAKSMALNVAEGGKRTGKDRSYHFSVSAGSADELKTALEIAVAFGHVDATDLEAAMKLLDRELAMLWRLRNPKR